MHVDRVKHLRQEDFHRHFDSKAPKPDSPSSAEEETNRSEPSRRPRQLKRRKNTPRAGTPPQEYQLVREQRLPAGEFREYIVTDHSDHLTADESPTPSEGEAPQPAAAQPDPNQVNVQKRSRPDMTGMQGLTSFLQAQKNREQRSRKTIPSLLSKVA